MNGYADRFTALIDACVMGGALRRNMLLGLAEAGFSGRAGARAFLMKPRRQSPRLRKGHGRIETARGNRSGVPDVFGHWP